MIKLIKAFRQAYDNAKFISHWQVGLAAAAALGAVVTHFFSGAKSWVGLFGIVIVLTDEVLETKAKSRHHAGAEIQELFDTELFKLPRINWTAPDHEVRDELSEQFDQSHPDAKELEDWYPKVVDELDLPYARLVCQRSNLQWDAALRDQLWQLYALALAVIAVAGVGWCLARQLSMEEAIATCAVPVLPSIMQLWRKLSAHRSAGKSSNSAKEKVDELWARATSEIVGQAEVERQSQRLHVGLYERRRTSPQVPNLLYRAKRKKFETRMRNAAEEMVREIKAKTESKD